MGYFREPSAQQGQFDLDSPDVVRSADLLRLGHQRCGENRQIVADAAARCDRCLAVLARATIGPADFCVRGDRIRAVAATAAEPDQWVTVPLAADIQARRRERNGQPDSG